MAGYITAFAKEKRAITDQFCFTLHASQVDPTNAKAHNRRSYIFAHAVHCFPAAGRRSS